MIFKCPNCGKWYREHEKHLLECPHCSKVLEIEISISKHMKKEADKDK